MKNLVFPPGTVGNNCCWTGSLRFEVGLSKRTSSLRPTRTQGVDDCPPSRRLMSIHGVDRATQIAYALRINTGVTKRKSTETRFCLDQDADIIDGNASVSIKGGIICEQKGGATPSGDGTVPLASLEHCLKWKDTIDVRLSRLRDAEHRGMLAEPQFHMAIADALTPNYWSQGIQWVPVCRGDRLALGGVFVGTTATDGDVYVARSEMCSRLKIPRRTTKGCLVFFRTWHLTLLRTTNRCGTTLQSFCTGCVTSVWGPSRTQCLS